MSLTDLPLLNGLKTAMQWHQQRQTMLAQNVANADTPGYRGRDLKPLASLEPGVVAPPLAPRLAAATTSPAHIALQSEAGQGPFTATRSKGFETTPNGNSVDIEDEMIKSGQNQIDYQAAASLYQRSLGMIRTALGRRG